MGTKLQYMINVLSAQPNSSRITEKAMEDWDYFKNKELKIDFKRTCIDNLHNSMDRILEQNNVETIKKTMIMHEKLFKNQVQELHRLYSVQKMLMNELKGEIKQTRLWSPRADVIRHTGCVDNFWAQEDQSSREMSSSFSGDKQRITRGVDLKGGDQEDNKMSVVEESEVELTLSIGTPTSSKRKQDNHLPNRSLELASSELTSGEVPDLGLRSSASFRGDECSDVPAAATETEDYRKQQQQQPHWLFQGLSLNKTQL